MQGKNIKQLFYHKSYLYSSPMKWEITDSNVSSLYIWKSQIWNSVSKTEIRAPHITSRKEYNVYPQGQIAQALLTFLEGFCKVDKNTQKAHMKVTCFFFQLYLSLASLWQSEILVQLLLGSDVKFCEGWNAVCYLHCYVTITQHDPWYTVRALWISVQWMCEWMTISNSP